MESAPDKSYCLVGAKYLGKQLKHLTKQLKGISAGKEDIEYIHQGRVTSRRIRAGLDMFGDCFESKDIKKWYKRIKKLTKGLGKARDLDVQIDYLSGLVEKAGHSNFKNIKGIKRIILRLRQRRHEVQPGVIKTVKKLEKSGIITELGAATARIIWQCRTSGVDETSEYSLKKTAEHIETKLEELLSHEFSLADETMKKEHHQMRIAAKKLRYSMEICKGLYNGAIDGHIRKLKKVQKLTGSIHDFDVWLEQIAAFEQNEHERTLKYFGFDRQMRTLQPGIEYLKRHFSTGRAELFAELKEYWKQLREEDAWGSLVEVMRQSTEQLAGFNQRPDRRQADEMSDADFPESSGIDEDQPDQTDESLFDQHIRANDSTD